MNKKKLIAVLAAATMLVSAVPVYAAPVETTGSAVGQQEGTGEIKDFEKDEIYKVTLPTDNALDFIIDPQNLTSIASGESVEVDLTTTGSGVIFSNGIAAIKNESNVDVVVTVKLTAEGPEGVTFLTEQTDWDGDDAENEMLLVAVPGINKVTIASGDAVENYAATGTAVAITDTDNELAFKLNAAKYVVTNTGDAFEYGIAEEEGNYDAVAFKIGGAVNKNADWKQFESEGVTLTAVFDIAKAEGSETAVDGLYNVVDTETIDYTAVEAAAGALGLSATKSSSYMVIKSTDEEAVIEGAKTDITVTIDGTEVEVYSISSGTVKIKITTDLGLEGGEEVVVTDANGNVFKGTYTAS